MFWANRGTYKTCRQQSKENNRLWCRGFVKCWPVKWWNIFDDKHLYIFMYWTNWKIFELLFCPLSMSPMKLKSRVNRTSEVHYELTIIMDHHWCTQNITSKKHNKHTTFKPKPVTKDETVILKNLKKISTRPLLHFVGLNVNWTELCY